MKIRKVLSTLLYLHKINRKKFGIRILMYHRVNDNYPEDRLCVKTAEFRKQMQFLLEHNYEVISLEKAVILLSIQKSKKCKLPTVNFKQKVVITFDDGFEDNYLNSYSVLKEYGFPATVFLTANSVGKNEFLKWEQILEMSKNYITFGAHTLNHFRLTEIPLEKAEVEIVKSKEIIESNGLRCDYFCYPGGYFNQDIKDLVIKAGFKSGCSIKPGANFPEQDLYELKRTEISGFDSPFDFRKKLAGAFDYLHELVQKHNTLYTVHRNKDKINVLYIIWSLGLGGAEQVVINLAKGLDKKKFNPIVCCLNEKGEFADELEENNIRVIALHKKVKFDFSIIKKIVKAIKENNVNIVHTHLWGANFWGRIAAKLAGVKHTIITIHNVDISHNRIELFLEKVLACLSCRIIAVGEAVRDFYSKKTGISNNRIKVIYNGVQTGKTNYPEVNLTALKKEFAIKDNEKVISIIGRLVPQKGHRYLLDALSLLNGQYKFKLLVVGNGPLRNALEPMARNNYLEDKVIFAGLRNDILQILEISDVLILPSIYEGIPIVILEAMSMRKPVIATDVGGNSELIISYYTNKDEATGILVPAENTHELAKAIEILINNPSLAKSMGEAGYERLKKYFSVERMLQETEGLYLSLINSGRNN